MYHTNIIIEIFQDNQYYLICLLYVQFLEEFVAFLDKWKEEINAREGFSKSERDKMFLSHQTYEGIVTTGKCKFKHKIITQTLCKNR